MRRSATVVVLVLALFVAPVTRADLPNAAAATDWSGEYDGSFDDIDEFAALVLSDNDVRFAVDLLVLRGSLTLRVRPAPRSTTPRTSPPGLGFDFGNFEIEICAVFEITLTGGELRGIPVEGDEVNWSGQVDLAVGGGEPGKVNCGTVAPSQMREAKLDVTVGSSGLRGALSLDDFPLPFTAERAGAAPTTATTAIPPPRPGLGEQVRANLRAFANHWLGADTTSLIDQRLGAKPTFGPYSKREFEFDEEIEDASGEVTTTVAMALLLVHASVDDGHGRRVAAFPTVRALAPVLTSLGAHAVTEDRRMKRDAVRKLQLLLDIAINLDTRS